MGKVYVSLFYGLGGGIWSGGIEYVLRPKIVRIPGVICPPTKGHKQWPIALEEIKAQLKKDPSTKIVAIGHSMGAGAASYLTDHVRVNLLVLYDTAGQIPSRIGKNCDKCYDIHDTVPDMVPDGPAFRIKTVAGYENAADGSPRIERWETKDGHTGQDDDPILANKVCELIKKLANN